jgi:UDP-glucuronate 4-epimerase
MKILVTGGAGFIGSHLVEALLLAGHFVDNMDNFSDYYSPEIKRDNISQILGHERHRFFQGDIRDRTFLASHFEGSSYDLVIHLAAMAGVRLSIRQPALYTDVNISGTQNLLEQCRLYGVTKFIFASSSSVYGNNTNLPFKETDPVDNPISPYAATKKSGELLCYTYHHLFRISVLGLRFFTVYGPRQRTDLAIHKFAKKISQNESIELYGDGNSARDYTYISDIISGIMGAIDYINSHDCYEIINLGEARTITLRQMVNILLEEMDMKADYKFVSRQPGDAEITYADISKAKRLLNYKPETDFREGIRKFVIWFKQKNRLEV